MFFGMVPNMLNICDYMAAGSSDAYIFATQEIR
jgi:hypothetical protein